MYTIFTGRDAISYYSLFVMGSQEQPGKSLIEDRAKRKVPKRFFTLKPPSRDATPPHHRTTRTTHHRLFLVYNIFTQRFLVYNEKGFLFCASQYNFLCIQRLFIAVDTCLFFVYEEIRVSLYTKYDNVTSMCT